MLMLCQLGTYCYQYNRLHSENARVTFREKRKNLGIRKSNNFFTHTVKGSGRKMNPGCRSLPAASVLCSRFKAKV